MKVKLLSDFVDYYDHWFDLEGIEFKRYSRSGMDRFAMFRFMEKLRINTPDYGTVREIHEQNQRKTKAGREASCWQKVVVHLDVNAHRGEGKVLMSIDEAYETYPDKFCVGFIHPTAFMPCTIRYLRVGNRFFWLEYTSNDPWRSNCGSEINIKITRHGTIDEFNYVNLDEPLFAIDLVDGRMNKYITGSWAIDYNIAPQIRGTGVEEILSAKDCADEIKQKYVHLAGT